MLVAVPGCADQDRERSQVQAVGSAAPLDDAAPLIDASFPGPPDGGYAGEVLPQPVVIAPDASTPPGLKALADRVAESPAVLVASCTSAVPRLESDGHRVVTDVSFTIERTLKGATTVSDINITVDGGMLEDRGTISPHAGKYQAGARYLLFPWSDESGLVLASDNTSNALIESDRVVYLGRSVSTADVRSVLPTL